MAELTVPSMDFSTLGNLGKIYKEAQNEQGLKDAFSQGIGSDPQSLAALAQKVAPYNPQLGINLAQLAHGYQRQGTQDARQQSLDQFNQNMRQKEYDLSVRRADRADMGVEDKAADRAKAAESYGLQRGTPEFKTFVLTGELPSANSTVADQTAQRTAAAKSIGLTPDHPGYQSFVLTGKMPREDAQPLTATDKKAILEADEAVLTNQAAIDSLGRASRLSKDAYSGLGAGMRGYVTSFLGKDSDLGKSGIATENLTNEVMTNALGQLKSIFGGAPTEGERKILLDMQGSVTKPHEVRKEIYERAMTAAQKRLDFNRKRADELRGNTYYKPNQNKPAPEAPTQARVIDWQSYFGGGQ